MFAIRTNANGVSVQSRIPAHCDIEDTRTVVRHDPQNTLTAAKTAFLQPEARYIKLVAEENEPLEPSGRSGTNLGQIGHEKFVESSDLPTRWVCQSLSGHR